MRKYKLRNGRRQATFGADGAIMAAATVAQTIAQIANARMQAKATEAAAREQASAIAEQNANNNKIQEKSIAFTKQQNEQNRDLQRQMQMQLAMMTGQQNANARLDAAKIQVKNGGSMRRKLRNAGTLLRGLNNNLPFTVTDGGGVIPITTTPEGYDLYEIVGNDHEHYHKAQGGKYKTGVGIKFYNVNNNNRIKRARGGYYSQTIEGEGNQNSNQGEFMLVTPNDAKFISKHSIKGFNPAKAILAGMNPMDAFETQEYLKDIYGISDDGKQSKNPRRKGLRYSGGDLMININDPLMHITSNDDNGVLASLATVGANVRDNAKCGTSIRKKAARGRFFTTLDNRYSRYASPRNSWLYGNNSNPINGLYQQLETSNNRTQGMAALANGIGATVQSIGTGISAAIGNRATRRAAQSLRDAYNNLRGIDESAVNIDNYRAAHALAATQTPYVSTGAETTASERALQRSLKDINRGNANSAAAQARMNLANTAHIDNVGQIQANADKIKQGIIAQNMDAINRTSMFNAQLDQQARQDYAKDRLQLLMYNNGIANERVLGLGQVNADEYTGIAQNTGAAIQSIANNLSNSGNQVASNMLMGRQQLNDFRTNAIIAGARLDPNDANRFYRTLGILRNGGNLNKHRLTLKY